MALDLKTRPNVLPWPPMIYGGAVALGVLAQWLAPRSLGPEAPARLPGLIMLVAGLGLDAWAMITMWRARVNILPHRAADRLLEAGPFSFTRNPIYLGNTTAVLGLAGLLNSLWMALAGLAAAALTSKLAIEREEAHLALRFGDAWKDYSARVPRWIGGLTATRRRKG